MDDGRVAALEEQVRRLTEMVDALQHEVTHSPRPVDLSSQSAPVSRRAALRSAGVVAAGALAAGVGVVSTAAPAAAASGSFTGDPAVFAYNSTGVGYGVWASAPVGIRGESDGSSPNEGIAGVAINGTGGTGGRFHGAVALKVQGDYHSFYIDPTGTVIDPTSTPTALNTVTVDVDTTGQLWYGYDSKWRKLASPASAGAFHAIDPIRAYDSRKTQPSPGVMANNGSRTVSLAHQRDATTGAISVSDVVPAGAVAVAANVTVTSTTGRNFLCVNPGGNLTRGSSVINWFAADQTLANGVILKLGTGLYQRQVTLLAGAQGGSAHVIIDVTGYWL